MKTHYTLGVIGGGFMAQAIVFGAIGCQYLGCHEIIVGEPSEEKREIWTRAHVSVTNDNRVVAQSCDYLLFAVKPQTFPEVAEALRECKLPVLVSIMAGVSKAGIRSKLCDAEKIVRVMPNLPCSVGMGAIGLDASELSGQEREFVIGLFSSVGKVEEVEEGLLNAVTGLSGSGPAYVYYFLQALIEAGARQGLSEEQARELALQTVKGGVEMAERNSNKSLEQLIAAVSSKGGTTVAALGVLEERNVKGSFCDAVSAAVKRAEELSQ